MGSPLSVRSLENNRRPRYEAYAARQGRPISDYSPIQSPGSARGRIDTPPSNEILRIHPRSRCGHCACSYEDIKDVKRKSDPGVVPCKSECISSVNPTKHPGGNDKVYL
jgi:hypothetical protein